MLARLFAPHVQGLQTFLTMLGSTVMIPLLLVPAMGGTTQGKPARALGWGVQRLALPAP